MTNSNILWGILSIAFQIALYFIWPEALIISQVGLAYMSLITVLDSGSRDVSLVKYHPVFLNIPVIVIFIFGAIAMCLFKLWDMYGTRFNNWFDSINFKKLLNIKSKNGTEQV